MTPRRVVYPFVAALVAGATIAAAQPVPTHPRELTYPALSFTPPDPAASRRVLKNKVVGHFVEDHALPLVTVTVLVRGGSYVEPADKAGLASLTGSQMRAGGAGERSAEAFDEAADFLAAQISGGFGPTTGAVSANFLAKDTDAALALLFDVLRRPRFEQARLDLARSQALQAMERRNDSTDAIEGREWARLMRGEHFSTRPTTRAGLEAITRDDLVAFHTTWVHPGNFVLAVSGDFDTTAMIAKLDTLMAGWAAGTKAPPVPKPTHVPVPGVYLIDKPDVNQGRVSLGHLGYLQGNPDEYAIDLMNDILGGSGFTSRITNRVRSDEGLAYSAGSSISAGTYYEGLFRAGFQSKSESVARAIQIVLDEVTRIRTQPVSAEELETVKTSAIETFPRAFASAGAVASTFASNEISGRPATYYATYRDKVRAVTVADIQRVAQRYLQPDRVVILAVGNVQALKAGDRDRPEYSLDKLAGSRGITLIPLPDPLTTVYPKQP